MAASALAGERKAHRGPRPNHAFDKGQRPPRKLLRAVIARLLRPNGQASPDLTTLDSEITAAREALRWRRRESNPRKKIIGLCREKLCSRAGPRCIVSPSGLPDSLRDSFKRPRRVLLIREMGKLNNIGTTWPARPAVAFACPRELALGVLVEWKLKGLDPNGMQRWWKHVIATAGIPYIKMHAARHTAITDFLRKTGNLKLAQLYARHTDISTTGNVYGHLDVGDLEAALERIHDS